MNDLSDVIRLNRLSCSFRNQEALRDLSLSIPQGTIFGLVGLNGAGKTTLIRFLIGALKAQAGCVQVLGQDPTQATEKLLQRIGYVPEEDMLPRWMKVGEYLDFLKTFYPNWDASLCQRMLDRFGLAKSKKIADLSKGGRARVALLSAIAHRPELLILDEPSYGLDPIARQEILETVIQAASEEGRTVFFSSHLLDEVSRICEQVALIHQGRIEEVVSLNALSDKYCEAVFAAETKESGPPQITGLFGWQRYGREWSVIVDRSIWASEEQLHASLHQPTSFEVRPVSLERWFSARVSNQPMIDHPEQVTT